MSIKSLRQSPTWLGIVTVVVVAVLYGLMAPSDYYLTVGFTVAVSAISAIGLTVVVGRAGQLALGQAGFMAIGAYAVAYGTTEMGLPFLVALLVGAIVALALGLLVGYAALRLKGDYLAVATLAVGAIVYGLLQVDGPFGGSGGILGIPPISVFGTDIVSPFGAYVFSWIVVLVTLVACALYLRGRAGRELASLRDDDIAAASVGVHNTFRKLQAFGVSAIFGAVAGGLMAANQTVIDPSLFTPSISFQIFLMVVIGGLGSLGGAVLGAATVVWLVQLTPGTGDSAYVVLGALIVLLMAVLPRGLAGLFDALAARIGLRRSAASSGGVPPAATPEPEAAR
jgi:branched-chain amino acid transport system permease protein